MDSEEPITYKCPKCNGLCVEDKQILMVCKFCYGQKELNWIENIFGVKNPWKEAIDQMVSIQPMDSSVGQIFHLKVKKNKNGDL
jgi:hypothetical protein